MRNRRPHCGCPRPNCGCPGKKVVHPVKENVVHCCSEETIKHVHPSHTTVVNHHLVKNKHVFPHSTSFENTFNEVDVFGGAFNTPPVGPGNQVGGATSPGMGPGMAPGMTPGMGHGMAPGKPPHGAMPGQVGGAMSPGMGHGPGAGCGPKKTHKWC